MPLQSVLGKILFKSINIRNTYAAAEMRVSINSSLMTSLHHCHDNTTSAAAAAACCAFTVCADVSV